MQVCTICQHPDLVTINAEVLKGTGSRTVAARWPVSRSAVVRHTRKCLRGTLTAASKASRAATVKASQEIIAPPEPPIPMRSSLSIWEEINQEIQACAEATPNGKRGALLALRIKHLELYTKLTGDYYQAGENPHDLKRKQEEAIRSYQDQIEQECGARPPRPEAIAALAEQHPDFRHVN